MSSKSALFWCKIIWLIYFLFLAAVSVALILEGIVLILLWDDYGLFISSELFTGLWVATIILGVTVTFTTIAIITSIVKECAPLVLICSCLFGFTFLVSLLLGIGHFEQLNQNIEAEVESTMLRDIPSNSSAYSTMTMDDWNNIQTKFHCCGAMNYKDWVDAGIPDSCCPPVTNGCEAYIKDAPIQYIFEYPGCSPIISANVRYQIDSAARLCIGAGLVQLIACVFGIMYSFVLLQLRGLIIVKQGMWYTRKQHDTNTSIPYSVFDDAAKPPEVDTAQQ